MNKVFSGIILASLIIGTFAGLRYAVSEKARLGGAVVRFIPSSLTVACGDIFTVALVTENVEDLVIFDVKFRWNTTRIQYVNHTLTVPAEDYPAPNPPSPYSGVIIDNGNLFFLRDDVNDPQLGLGTYWGAVTQIPAPSYVGFNGNGTIGVFIFRALNEPGPSYLEFMDCAAANSAGEPIPLETIPGEVNVWGLTVSIISPENMTYNAPNVPLTFTIDDPPVWIGYALDEAANETISGNTTLVGLSEGPHHVVVYANSSDGRVGWKAKCFTIDTTPPIISVLSPENRTYPTDTMMIVFTVDEAIIWSGISMDGSPTATSGNTTLVNLSDGTHFVQIYANDTVSNMGTSSKVYFTIDTAPPTFEAVGWRGTAPYPYVPSLRIRAGEPVLVTSTIVDPSGVTCANICYRTDGGCWWNGTMIYNTNESAWMSTLPGQAGGQTVEFFIIAYDPFGHAASTQLYSFDTFSLLIGDVDGDGDVDIFDIVAAAGHYGDSW